MVYSTIVKNVRQIDFFMQNKANPSTPLRTSFRKSQMDIKLIKTREYEKKFHWTFGENKPNPSTVRLRSPQASLRACPELVEGTGQSQLLPAISPKTCAYSVYPSLLLERCPSGLRSSLGKAV
jgi:hypothetical protein